MQPATTSAAATLCVTSETAPLRAVIVHTPGAEMELVAPSLLEKLLFEDILFVGTAREEHRAMCEVIRKATGRAAGVLQLTTLLREAFQASDAREAFVEGLSALAPERNLRPFADDLLALEPDELFRFAVTGQSPLPLTVPPVPNLLFMRDVAAVVHDHIVLSHPATAARARESVIMRTILEHHPRFANARNRIVRLPPGVTFEGGDLLVAAPDTVLVGHSERTSFGGIVALAEALFARTPLRHVLVVDLPKRRACMHLDTVFTFASPDECCVYPPLVEHLAHGNLVELAAGEAPGQFSMAVRSDLKDTLEARLGRSLTFIPCGGDDPLQQEREQWTDGANFFAIAPGVVVGYERNRRTFDTMSRHGYRTVTAQGFLDYHAESEVAPDQKLAIKLPGTELSRGRGGPRCMTLPLARVER